MEFKLEKFEGPLDLLLRLIQRAEIDIHDIPISQITAEYMEVVSGLPPDMEQMSEFLVMAATLLEIKSKMLLPRPKIESDEPEEDPREALARQLLAYQQAQELAARLGQLTPVGERLTGAGDPAALAQLSDPAAYQPVMDLVSIPQLTEIFADIMRRMSDKIDTVRAGYGEMPKEKFTITEKISFIKQALQALQKETNAPGEKKHIALSALFQNCQSRREMLVTFLALLEMIRLGIVSARQTRAFDDVEVFSL
ncbi:MAG: segregation/condensation protein A [Defluviitaleaceae bacterium]|nr:segregation/condensation protein A [Defluviitaleaceae bacterium]